MKDDHKILRAAIGGLFDIQAEPQHVVVTAPAALCNEFYQFLDEHHPESRQMMLRPPLELGQEIHFSNASADQIVQWIERFAQELDPSAVSRCYRAIYPQPSTPKLS